MKSQRIKFVEVLLFAFLFATLLFMSVGCASGVTAPEEEWNMTFGGTDYERADSVQQTTDGGYIIAGRTQSYGAGDFDFWLVKTNLTGIEQWNQTFGDTYSDRAESVQKTIDGGYIIAGDTKSYGAGSADFWLVKTDSNGTEQWNQTFGGTGWDSAYAVQQTADGGYILAGDTKSYGAGSADFWLVKTDSNGTEQWNQTFGGPDEDGARSVQQTEDGGYILVGWTESYGAGSYDFWLVKTDSNGNEQWNQTFGGTGDDGPSSVQQTSDGSYILAGWTYSYGAGSYDFWLVKTDSNDTEQWNQTFGGTDYDVANSVQQTADGGYILTGWTLSYGTGGDFWLVKTDSNGTEQWNKTFGGTGGDSAYAVQQTADGGYILAGDTQSYGAGSADFWLVKVKGEKPTEPPVHNIDTGKNFSTIQAAIYAPNTTHGHIIAVDPETYNENVKVNKSLTIRSTSGNPADTIVQAASSNDHVFEVTADYVNISGFTVTGASNPYTGISLDHVVHCNISDNNVSNNFDGIYLSYASNNTITSNTASNNSHGIYLGSSGNNIISGNDASNNELDGIYPGVASIIPLRAIISATTTSPAFTSSFPLTIPFQAILSATTTFLVSTSYLPSTITLQATPL